MAYYFDRKNWSFSPEPPGVRVPLPLLLLGIPAAGLAFVVWMPFIGFWLVGKHLVVGCARGAARLMALVQRVAC